VLSITGGAPVAAGKHFATIHEALGNDIGATADPLTRGAGTWTFDASGTITNNAAASYDVGDIVVDGASAVLTLVDSITMGALTVAANDSLLFNASANAVTLTATGLTNNNVVQVADSTSTVTLDLGGGIFSGTDIDYNGKAITLANIDYDPDMVLGANEQVTVSSNSTFDAITASAAATSRLTIAGAGTTLTMSGALNVSAGSSVVTNAAGKFILNAGSAQALTPGGNDLGDFQISANQRQELFRFRPRQQRCHGNS